MSSETYLSMPSIPWSSDRETHSDIPQPAGYRILVEPVKLEEKTEGGIVLPDQVHQVEELTGQLGVVVAMGPQCFDHAKFNGYRYCDPGDYILHGQYAGVTVRMRDGRRYRLIHDDDVLALVPDPKAIKRTV